jgi:hypothetical protein
MSETGLKNEYQVGKILVSGSLALKEKNPAGLRVFEQSDDGGGIISGKLIRPKYNITELKKSIDTTIFELIPQTAPILEDTVLRSVYNIVTQSVNDLTLEVEVLNTSILNLNSKISEIEIVSESLKIELDNEKLKASISENQALIANEQIASTTIDLQNSIQNSINEAIQRVSLTARSEALEKENENLRNQLFGINTQLQTGAAAGSSNKVTAKFVGLGEDGTTINAFAGHKSLPGSAAFVNANKLQINNVTSNLKITNISFVVSGGPTWFGIRPGGPNAIDAEGQATYDLVFNQSVLAVMKPYIKGKILGINQWEGSAQAHTNTNLTINVVFDDGSSDSVVLNSKLQKNRN